MFDELRPEVLVVGAGPVGLFTALALARRNVNVRIIDTGVWACTHSYALAVHPQALDLFAQLGLKERILADSYAVRRIAFCGLDGARVAVDAGDAQHPLAVVRQDALENLLEDELEKLGVRVGWRHEAAAIAQADDHARVTVQKFEKESRGYIVAHTEWVVAKTWEVEPRFVIGADGYNSRVRRTLDAEFPEVGPAQYFAVFEFKTDADLQHTVRVALDGGTMNVLWPLPGGAARWSFELPGYSPAAPDPVEALRKAGFGDFPSERQKDRVLLSHGLDLPVLDEAHLREYLRERAPWFTGSIEKLTWRIVVRFERRLAKRFGAGRLWLAGDAAHLTGPAGVHSMNLGFWEGADLAARLESALRGGAGAEALADYDARWQKVWRQLHGLERVPQPGPQTDAWVADHAPQILASLPAWGPAYEDMAARLGLMLA
jgi:2-polyprenyl-6-methoxyphenol hydroxylase-like FAD-dependent oxidoreductase